MKIGLANNLYPPYGRDSGAEVVSQNMALDLEKAGHSVFIITTQPKKAKRLNSKNIYYLKSNYEALNKFSLLRKLVWHLFQLIKAPHQKELRQIIEVEKPDLFITHNLLGLSFALPKILAQNNIEHHHVLHDIQLLHPSGLMYFGEEKKLNSFSAKIYQSFTKKIFKNTKKIISPSKWLLEKHQERNFFNHCEQEIIPNFKLEKIQPKKKSELVQFLFAGQLEPHKGIKLLLSAWQASGLSESEAQLSIAGSGSLNNLVESEAQKSTNINYLGHISRDRIKETLEAHDLVILPSLIYENSPTIIWEAAKYGLSAIAADIGGTKELDKYLNLKLFEAGNEAELVKLILTAAKE